MEENNKIKNLKKTVMQQLKALKPDPRASPEEAIEALVKQAEFYTNFLLSQHETSKKIKSSETKRRGHFEDEDSEVKHMIDE